MVLALVCFLAGCAGTKIQRQYGAPSWEPEPVHAVEAERREFYEMHRIRSVEDGCSEVRGKYYGSQGMQRYFLWAKANEAGSLLRQGRHENAKSAVFPLICVGAFAGASTLGYQLYLSNQPREYSYYSSSERDQSYIATLGGIGVGALVGIVVRNNFLKRSHIKRIEAAESFNRHLLKRLDFRVNPRPGGGEAGVGMSF